MWITRMKKDTRYQKDLFLPTSGFLQTQCPQKSAKKKRASTKMPKMLMILEQ